MAHTIPFDTHAFVKKLQAAGMPEAQAEVQAEAIADLVNDQLATKRDLQELELRLKNELKQLELRLTLRFGAMLVAAIGILKALDKLF